MRRSPLRLLCAATLLASVPVSAELLVSGRVADAEGAPVAGALVELLPERGEFAAGRDELAGRLEPEPAATAASGADGRFALEAPGPGLWLLRIGGDGLVPAVARLQPLVEDRVLPTLTVRRSSPFEVVVRGPGGEPVAGAVVTASTSSPRLWQEPGLSRTVWWPAARRAVTDERGVARLARAGGERLEVSVFARCHASPEPSITGSARLELRLEPGRQVKVRVLDERRTPVAGALVSAGEPRRALGLSAEDGRLETWLGDERSLRAVGADGSHGAARLPEAGSDVEVTLAAPLRLGGRVVDAESREPLPRALVWPLGREEGLVLTDGGGRFELVAPAGGGPPALQAAARGYFPTRARQTGGGAGETVLALHPAATVTGQVFDAGGEPLAEVELTASIEAPRRSRRRFAGGGRAPLARSGEDGGFRLAGLTPEVALRLLARKPGWADTELELPPLEPREQRTGVRLTMSRGASLTGTIAGQGEPVPGAEIAVARQPSGVAAYARLAPYQFEPVRTAVGDGEGRFELPNLAPGVYRLTVRAAGWAPLETPAIELEQGAGPLELGTLELAPGEEITGVVVDAGGEPVAGAEVATRSRTAGSARYLFRGGEPVVTTGADGRFVIADRSAGELIDLVFSHPEHVAFDLRGVVVPPEEPLRIVLESAASLAGQVVDPGGGPVARARIVVAPEEASGLAGGTNTRQGVSGDTGEFEIDGIRPGRVRVHAHAAGWVDSEPLPLELAAGGQRAGVRLELRRGATVRGEVLAADGTPVADAVVRVEDPGARPLFGLPTAARSDGDGRYQLDGVEPGRRTLVASHGELGRTAREVEIAPGVNQLDLRFIGGVELSGRVVEGGGAPVAGATVTLLAGADDWRGTEAHSGADGGFTLSGVRDGQHILRAAKSGFATRTVEPPVEVAGAPIAGIEIVLEPGSAVSGRILGVEPAELAQVTVMARRSRGEMSLGRVDRDGTYRVPDLAPGEWQVHASVGHGRETSAAVTVAEGPVETTLDLDFSGGLVLSGQVLQDGRPLPALYVIAQGNEVTTTASTRTDHQGRFRLEGLEAGPYELRVTDFMSGLQHREQVELDGDRDLLVEIGTARISGWVLDAENRGPLTGATITLEPEEDSDAPRFALPQFVTSGAEGRFALGAVAAGPYRLSAEHEGYAPLSLTLTVAAAVDQEGIELALVPSTGLGLTVRYATGAPVGEISWALVDAEGRSHADGRRPTDENGRARLGSVPDGRFDLLLASPGTAVARLPVELPGPPLVVALEPPATLELEVAGLEGSDVRATARIYGPDGRPFLDLRWGGVQREWQLAGGRATIHRLPAGRYRVEVSARDGRRWEAETGVAAGALNRLGL